MPTERTHHTLDLEQFFALSVDLMCIANFESYFLRINPSFQRVLGHAPEEMLGHPFLDFVHPDDRDATLKEVAGLSAGVTTVDFENRYRCADGSYRWLAWHARPEVASGLIYAVARDVTVARLDAAALIDREARLRAVFEGTVDAMVTIDPRGTIESCNPALRAMFGYPQDEIIGRDVSTLMPEPYRSRHAGYVARYLATGEARIIGKGQREVSGLRADGSTFPLELGVSEINLSDRKVFLGILRDISARKRVEEANAELLAREARERGRTEFAAGILHDLGNVLTGLGTSVTEVRAAMSHAELNNELPRTARFVRSEREALAAALGGARADALADILEGIERSHAQARDEVAAGLAKLTAAVEHAHDLLEAHRSQSEVGGRGRARKRSVADAMASVRALIVDNLTARGGELELYVPSHARTVLVDQVLLVRALVNGARNALDAFDAAPMAAPPRIVLRVDVDADRSLRFTMTDNGPGFRGSGEDFFADGRTTRARGSGFGLGSARRAVAMMGGTVSLTSPGPDRGAEFVITLPPREEAAR